MEPEELAAALRDLAAWAERHAPRPEPALRRRLREHFGGDPAELPIVTRPLAAWDRPNVQVALDEWLPGREVDVIGLPLMQGYRAGLAELVRGAEWMPELQPGGVEHITVPLGEDESITCVQAGVWLIRDVYRGRVLELGSRYFHDDESAPLTVRSLPSIARDRIVLPDGVLEQVERQAFAMAKHAERLRASGRHIRRGLLLHGPPGVGKTLTAMYLATQMPDRTVVLLTGQSLGAVGPSVDLATALQPAMLVLEDVDLVAMDRGYEDTNVILFELLNAMDGLDEDHDLLFVLTTNRADLLEPALAARPGRIDQAVELPLPDAEGRRRLIALYGEGLDLRLEREDEIVSEIAGTSPAFIRELLRRAALIAAEQTEGPLRVVDDHVRAALDELRRSGGELTQTLLGARPAGDADEDDDEDWD